MTVTARVLGISVWGPGLEGWAASRPILAGSAPHEPRPSPPPAPALLPPTERRRTGPVIRLALAVAQEAAAMSGLNPATLRAVFASSNGDGPVVASILTALAAAAPGERVVSPTQFHNSVHNAAAGYWSIATGSQRPATCIGCNDDTFAAALLTAMADLTEPVLLCCYDYPLPPPLDAVRPTGPAFAAGLVLGREGDGPTLTLTPERSPAPCLALPFGLQRNPAARALPLLAALASSTPTSIALPYLGAHLRLELRA